MLTSIPRILVSLVIPDSVGFVPAILMKISSTQSRWRNICPTALDAVILSVVGVLYGTAKSSSHGVDAHDSRYASTHTY